MGSSKALIAAAAVVPLLLLSMLVLGGETDRPDNCGTPTPAAPTASGAVVIPVAAGSYQISSPFGPRDGGMHYGQDMAGPTGTPILAATDGTVAAAGHATGFGDWIVVDTTIDGGKLSTVYGHMYDDGVLVKTGDTVRAGQHIANMGSNGESSGPHLHFEVWPGGRLSGGKAIDPMPWLTQHGANPAAPAPTKPAPATPDTNTLAAATSGGGGEMPVMPASKGSEAHWQVDTVRVARAVAQKFPQVQTIGGWRPVDAYDDHPSGRAADIMIPNFASPEGKALGDQVADYVLANKSVFHVVYIIWQQNYRPANGSPNTMEDRGSPTQNHMDHVHVTVEGHGMPAPGQKYGPVPDGGPTTAPSSGPCAGVPPVGGGGGNLKVGSVPPAFEPWIVKAGGTCKEVTSPIVAAQLDDESKFDVNAHNAGSGADGPSQFTPDTWAAKAVDGDGDGRKDPRSIPDAVMSQAAYDCELAQIAKAGLGSGKLHGDLTELYLSMYNCGPGATEGSGGVCQNGETRNYVKNIPQRAASVFAADPTTASVAA